MFKLDVADDDTIVLNYKLQVIERPAMWYCPYIPLTITKTATYKPTWEIMTTIHIPTMNEST